MGHKLTHLFNIVLTESRYNHYSFNEIISFTLQIWLQ